MIKHKCNGCVFLNKINGMPKCSVGRLDYFEYELDEENNPILNRFCNTSRPEEWLDDLSVDESSDLITTVMKEVQPRVGFFIKFDSDIEALKKTISDIKKQAIAARYVVIINPRVEFNQEIQQILVSSFDFNETKHHIVQILDMPTNKSFLIDEAFKHAKNGWIYVCNAGHKIKHTLIEDIHNRVNVQMKRLIIVEPMDDDGNGFLFQAALFKFLNGNKTKVFSDSESSTALFFDKAKEAAARSAADTLITWGDFYGT